MPLPTLYIYHCLLEIHENKNELYNILPQTVKNLTGQKFKRYIKNELLPKCHYNDIEYITNPPAAIDLNIK